HLLRMDWLALEPLAVRDVDADQLHPWAGAVFHVARVREHRDRLATAREQVQVVAARVAALESDLPEGRSTRPVGSRMELREGPADQHGAPVSQQALRHLV